MARATNQTCTTTGKMNDTKRNGYGYYRQKTKSKGWVIVRDSQLEQEEKEEEGEWERMWRKPFWRPELTAENGCPDFYKRTACNGKSR